MSNTANPSFYGGSKPAATPKYPDGDFMPKNKNRVPNIDAEPSNYDWLEFALYLVIGLSISHYFGYIIALISLWIIKKSKRYLIKKYLGLESLTCMDYFFLYDNYKNRANIVAIAITTKFET